MQEDEEEENHVREAKRRSIRDCREDPANGEPAQGRSGGSAASWEDVPKAEEMEIARLFMSRKCF